MQNIKANVIGFKYFSASLEAVSAFLCSHKEFNTPDYTVFPGFCDVHVHFREPGFSYKETILTGSLAAAHGGYTAVCTMPNLSPVPDCTKNLREQTKIIKGTSLINIYPYGSITVGQGGEVLSDMEALSEYVVAFSDDGKGIQSEALMREGMRTAKKAGKVVVAHCEDNSLLCGGYIHKGEYARIHGHRGISSESEWLPIERDLSLVRETGASYHVCHISCKESVELIGKAKKEGLDVTCETAPHYLVLDDGCLCEDGRFKMNPPLRSAEDREAIIEGVKNGIVDMIATDHAPHSLEEKSRGLENSAFGIVGLETAFPVMYTSLVKTGIITLEKLTDIMAFAPRKRFNIPLNDSFTVWNLNEKYNIDPCGFLSKGKATPFEGREVFGKCCLTVCDGKIIYKNK